MRLVVVVDLAKNVSGSVVDDGLEVNFKKIKTKLPAHVEHLYCGGYNTATADIARLIALDKYVKVTVDKRLQDIEKYSEKLYQEKTQKSVKLQNMILQKEMVSLCMFHLQEYMLHLKNDSKDNVLIVCSEFGCQLLLTYALGISLDSVHSFAINPGSVILLDIHDMTSMNRIHF